MHVVSGVGSGLGYEVAAMLQAEDETVIGLARHQPDLAIDFIQTDLADEAQVDSAVKEIEARDGRLQAVIHCAGTLITPRPLSEFGYDDADRMMKVNAYGPARLTGGLEERIVCDGADVVFVSSTVVRRPQPEHLAYNMSKAALASYAEAFRVELAGRQTDARSVLLTAGAMDTGMRATAVGGREEHGLPKPAEVARFIGDAILRAPKSMELGEVSFFRRTNRPDRT